MFAIYNINGRAFRDSLEALKSVRKPNKAEVLDLQQDVAKDETLVIQGNESEAVANDNAIANYRQMLHLNERSEIVHTYQLMTHPVITIYSSETIGHTYQEMLKHRVNQFPVISPQLEIVGLINRLEVIDANYQKPQNAITDIMQTEVITIDPVSDVRRAAQAMYDYKLSALPVVNEQDHLVGIITKTDILKALIKDPPLSLWA